MINLDEGKIKAVYLIYFENDLKNRVYVGVSKDVKNRWNQHIKMLKRKKHENKPLQNYVNKYGMDDIIFKIYKKFSDDTSYDIMFQEEKNVGIEISESGCCLFNTSSLGVGVLDHSDETRKKLSVANKGRPKSIETRKKLSEARKGINKGKTYEEIYGEERGKELKRKLSENNPFKNKHHTIEAKNKISIANKGKLVGEKHPLFKKGHTTESKNKMSESHKGINKGKTYEEIYGEERGKELRNQRKYKKSESHKKKIGDGNKGKIVSEKTRKNLSEQNSKLSDNIDLIFKIKYLRIIEKKSINEIFLITKVTRYTIESVLKNRGLFYSKFSYMDEEIKNDRT